MHQVCGVFGCVIMSFSVGHFQTLVLANVMALTIVNDFSPTQLQMYNKIPFQQSCCVTAARLLTDPDSNVESAAGMKWSIVRSSFSFFVFAANFC